MQWHFIILIIFLAVVCYYDIRQNRIPNWLNITGILAGVLYHLIVGQMAGFLDAMFGILAGGGIMLLLYIFKALGAGDVKLFAAIGAICGVLFTLYSVMYSIVFAGIIALLILLFTRTFLVSMTVAILHIYESWKKKSLTALDEFKREFSNRYPFIYAVIPGVATTFYYMYLS